MDMMDLLPRLELASAIDSQAGGLEGKERPTGAKLSRILPLLFELWFAALQ